MLVLSSLDRTRWVEGWPGREVRHTPRVDEGNYRWLGIREDVILWTSVLCSFCFSAVMGLVDRNPSRHSLPFASLLGVPRPD